MASNIQAELKHLKKIYPHQLAAAFARTHLESLSSLAIDSQPYPHGLTSIVATVGPSSKDVEVIAQMLEAGCGVIRINLSHGNYEDHKQLIDNVRTAATKHWLPICLGVDTKGPEIRTGVLKEGREADIELASGSMVTITIDDSVKEACDENNVWVDYKNILEVVDIGKAISIDNGAISLVVREKGPYYMKCEVEYGGKLGSGKGVSLPGTDIDLPSVSEKDIQDINFGMDNDVDVVFASYIKNADAVKNIRDILGEKGKKIQIFSKIENREGVKKFDEILEVSDGIVISRGKLGVEIPYEKVFLAQKMITAKTIQAGKSIICSSQMLGSMVKNPKPTRAEVADIANAVMDGVDGLMLTTETSSGLWPFLCIGTQNRIAREAECAMYHRQMFEDLRLLCPKPANMRQTVAISAVEASIKCLASVIVVLAINGSNRTAAAISSYRPRCPIVVVTRDELTSRQMRLLRGVLPIWYRRPKESVYEKEVDVSIRYAMKMSELRGLLALNDSVVAVHASEAGSLNTDSLRILKYSRKS